MKSILHVCLTAPYQDNMGYDENIMPKYHVKQGYSVYLVSCFDEKDKKKLEEKIGTWVENHSCSDDDYYDDDEDLY